MSLRPALLVPLLLAACGGDLSTTDGGSVALGAAPADEGTAGESQGGGTSELTAGAWDDNLNYDWFTSYLADEDGLSGAPVLDPAERDDAHARFAGDRSPRTDVDVALLLDTTGSMSDELGYLTDQIGDIAGTIQAEFPDATLRFALVVYRDEGDEYVTRSFDFTPDLAAFQQHLARQHADGGGDYPEAADQGLEALLQLSWSVGADVARLAFWIADAPPHDDKARAVTDAFRGATGQDVHLYPVAASGVDDLAELTMRSGAQLTGGRYLFLTDDSGLGDHHAEPTLPCYFVTTLGDAMVRMVEIERTGVYVEPDPADVLRTGGDPTDGHCTLDDGTDVIAF